VQGQRTDGTSRLAHRSRRSIDLPLLAYGLTSGIVAVSAGTLAQSMLMVVVVAILLSMAANSVLSWFVAARRTDSPHS
jgi:hypothetical protein